MAGHMKDTKHIKEVFITVYIMWTIRQQLISRPDERVKPFQ